MASEPTTLLAALAELQKKATSPIHYHLQRSFCGKASCRRCRDGVGHGPYWYAYFQERGRTKTYYLGKAAPGEDEKEQAPAARRPEPQPRQQKPAHASVSYHLQRSYCGKERCRKCRDGGDGHGPYWYAYSIDAQGRTTRTYVGKDLPESVRADGTVARE